MLRAMPQTKAKPKITQRELRALRAEMARYGVPQIRVAATAKVTAAHVCNVLAGRDKSETRVIAIAQALVAEAKQVASALDSEKRGA
jgi:hypothetical protein